MYSTITMHLMGFNPYFTGLPILIYFSLSFRPEGYNRFNPYFTGLPILIPGNLRYEEFTPVFQSLFYWITYSYKTDEDGRMWIEPVSILILLDYLFLYFLNSSSENIGLSVSILILLDYLFLWKLKMEILEK